MKLPSLVLDCMKGLSGVALVAAVGCTSAEPPAVSPEPAAVLVPMAVAPAPVAPAAPPIEQVSFTPIPTPPVQIDPQPVAQQDGRRRRRRPPGVNPLNLGNGRHPIVRPACGRG